MTTVFKIFTIILALVPPNLQCDQDSIHGEISQHSRTSKRQGGKFLTNTRDPDDLLFVNTRASFINCIQGLCTNVTNYPSEEIRNALKNSPYATLFSNDVPDLINRFGVEEEEESLCAVKSYTIFPEIARNTANINKTIINIDGYKQGLQVEVCIHNRACNFSESLPVGHTSQCKQKYTSRKLLVYGENGAIAFDQFKIPSCCLCVLKQN